LRAAPGFKIDVYASGVNSARQMAWDDKGMIRDLNAITRQSAAAPSEADYGSPEF
jgi:hypothetical protein